LEYLGFVTNNYPGKSLRRLSHLEGRCEAGTIQWKSRQINLAPNQVQAYTNYLCNAFLIQRSERYDLEGKRIFETGEKYYFENLGLRNALAGYRPSYMNKLVENAIFNHLRYQGYSVKTGQLGKLELATFRKFLIIIPKWW
jgi:predicted AAA+ superfamily ATPase